MPRWGIWDCNSKVGKSSLNDDVLAPSIEALWTFIQKLGTAELVGLQSWTNRSQVCGLACNY